MLPATCLKVLKPSSVSKVRGGLRCLQLKQDGELLRMRYLRSPGWGVHRGTRCQVKGHNAEWKCHGTWRREQQWQGETHCTLGTDHVSKDTEDDRSQASSRKLGEL